MSTLPPSVTNWLPEIHEGRDGETEIVKLLNQLRRKLIGYSASGGLAYFSTAIGRGDVLKTSTDGSEAVGFIFEIPVVIPTFRVNFSGQIADSAGAGAFRVRLGGTWGSADGALVATLNATSPVFAKQAVSQSVTLNAATLLQITLQSTVGQVAQLRGGFVFGN